MFGAAIIPLLMSVAFAPAALAEFQAILGRYPTKRASTLPTLHLAQKEFGWISPEVMTYVAGLLELEPIKVYEVVTFYTMFHQKPPGKYLIEACATLPCALNGAGALLGHMEAKLGIHAGETTKDGRFTLKKVECLAACGSAPCLQVNGDYHESVTPERFDRMVGELR